MVHDTMSAMPLERTRTPFWVVDAIALAGIIAFVLTSKLDVQWGCGVILVILGYGQAHRALGAAQAAQASSQGTTINQTLPPVGGGPAGSALLVLGASLLAVLRSA